jgi:hypothetical protein
VSFLSSLESFQVTSPFGTLALNSCPFCRSAFFSFVGGYSLLAIFDGDDSISNSILCGFLTVSMSSEPLCSPYADVSPNTAAAGLGISSVFSLRDELLRDFRQKRIEELESASVTEPW